MIDILREDYGHALVQLGELYYVVRIDHTNGQVYSAGPDSPAEGGCWVSRITEAGVKYVANGRMKSTATRRYRKLVAEARAMS